MLELTEKKDLKISKEISSMFQLGTRQMKQEKSSSLSLTMKSEQS